MFFSRKEGEGDLKLCWLPTKLTGGCGWRGYEREDMETITGNGLSAEDRFQVQTKQRNLLLEV